MVTTTDIPGEMDDTQLITTTVKVRRYQSLNSQLRSLKISFASLSNNINTNSKVLDDMPDLVSDSDTDEDDGDEMFQQHEHPADRAKLMTMIVTITAERMHTLASLKFRNCKCCRSYSVAHIAQFIQRLASRLSCSFTNFQKCLVILFKLASNTKASQFGCIKKLILSAFMVHYSARVDLPTWHRITGLPVVVLKDLTSRWQNHSTPVSNGELLALRYVMRNAVLKRVRVI